jgi:AcrR family transcriptional regulator
MRKAKQTLNGLRERKKTQTREAIVAAALDLFERQGYDATTVEEIAEAAEVSPRTFFRYFESKAEVVLGQNEDSADLEEWLGSRPPEEGPVESVRHAMQEGMAEVAADATQLRKMRIMLGTPSLRPRAQEHFNEHQAEMAQHFAVRMGLADDALAPHVIAAAIGNAIWTVVNRWVAEDAPPEKLFAMIDEAFDLLAKGMN